MSKQGLVMSKEDNVATVVEEVSTGEKVTIRMGGETKEIKVTEAIPFGHKFCLAEIKKGEDVIKYGESLGAANQDINVGDYVHVHNLDSKRGRGDMID
ncbi:altronate dehydratase [Halobacteroides halobius DSM 5150]|uniref:Altronate dehydratase n=2 Tax=Halobacteroides TaxID=42417 RepID=L0KAK7_HALHC|nr:altronate dehydratase [Halobacteroides halobius DSM 5150]